MLMDAAPSCVLDPLSPRDSVEHQLVSRQFDGAENHIKLAYHILILHLLASKNTS
jgi:hypothetical protein